MVAIGTDIVEIARIEAVWRRHGQRFIERILTPDERRRLESQREPWRFLARRFAAKEAIAKTLGTGIGVQLSWQDICIQNRSGGAPLVALSSRGAELALRAGGRQVLLSISDERAYAVAFAVLLA
ncbi:MAG: holo-[acyl-carrier protein] synthase [Halieaceae bacterium]|jgi:holo-[acyl-carrier protein] synthase